MSLLKAADELCVTPAAVSHQIRTLEAHLGLPLFHRAGRQMTLTEAGHAFLPQVREGFERFGQAVSQLQNLGDGGVLTVSVAPSFAVKWLVPRLDRFQERHPAIDVRVDASNELATFVGDNIDIAVRFGSGRYPDLVVERLLSEAVFPVCSPRLLERAPIARPVDLAGHTLLHDDSSEDDQSCPTWQMWLRAAGMSDIDASRGPRFTLSSLVLEAAIHGKGVALAKATLAEADLRSGRLVRLFGEHTPIDFAYYIVAPRRKLALGKVDAFVSWLRAEAERDNRQ
jgi:LysR family glycine cleavage system transcriptional activator